MEQLDKYQKILKEQIIILKECQSNRALDSCLKCTQLLGCKIRDIYVQSVYKSMNKGKGGGFEF